MNRAVVSGQWSVARRRGGVGALVVVVLVVWVGVAGGQSDLPPVEARVVAKAGARVPLELAFTDETGKAVRLGDYFRRDRPVVLTMVYYRCPGLCPQTMQGMVKAAGAMPLAAGRDYQVVLVSFDPRDTAAAAAGKKAGYMKELGLPADAGGWTFLTGAGDSGRELGEAIGFGYLLDSRSGMFTHEAAIYVCTPDGRVARVMQGVDYDVNVLHDSLVAASAGKISTGLWGVALACGLLHFDAATGRYTWAALALMRIVGGATVLILAVAIGRMIYREAARKKQAAA